jgi:four helix bundle protein
MEEKKTYRDLIVWQKGMDLAEAVCKATMTFPKEELYGLSSQLKRASISIPSNIAEGQGRYSRLDFVRFLRYSKGSLSELETQLTLARRLDYLSAEKENTFLDQATELRRLLNALIGSMNRRMEKNELLSTNN